MDLFEEIENIGKRPVIAHIGGFRPENDIISSFGGGFYLKSDMEWPSDDDGFMLPVIQIAVSEVPQGQSIFGDTKLVQIFINSKRIPAGSSKNGDGWLLKEYKDMNDLILVETPTGSEVYKHFQIKWSTYEGIDTPCWEEAWNYFDLTEINESEELSNRFFDEFERYIYTKIGGYAAFVQSPCRRPDEYVFQISSEVKPRFMVGDNGKLYVCKSKETNEWYLEWDCY